MTCAEFQRVLPYIIESGGNAEEEQHLRECRICSDLVQDLRYIAEQAKLLVPMEDPSPQVWEGIRGSLEREGLVKKPARARGRLLGSHITISWIGALGVLGIVCLGLFLYVRPGTRVPTAQAAQKLPQDEQILQAVSQSRPALRDTYAQNLKLINASIEQSRAALQRDPADADARDDLRQAYRQKTMLDLMAKRPLP